MSKLTISGLSKEKAFEVWAIHSTNGFHNGVCLKMSRFNHSCRPNAQYFWNDDTNTRDLRALRKIKEGKEITVSYIHSMLEPRGGRRSALRISSTFKNQFNEDTVWNKNTTHSECLFATLRCSNEKSIQFCLLEKEDGCWMLSSINIYKCRWQCKCPFPWQWVPS